MKSETKFHSDKFAWEAGRKCILIIDKLRKQGKLW